MSSVITGGSPDCGRRKHQVFDSDREEDDSIRVKNEPDADIKDYAETTMNELLGWYGLGKLDTRGLNLKNINHHFPTSSSSSSPQRHDDESDDDLERSSRSPIIESESLISNPSNESIICAWCLKTGLKLFTLKTASGKTKVFCSEPCFNQCRRAAFKKNRVCNWCRHVRHTVNYVDFKDGDEQLQFCSDKCLNQYKMQIFCRETQAYLQMNPHLQEETNKNTGTANSKLITPDLWLRDCQDPTNGDSGQNVTNSDEDPASPNLRTVPPDTESEVDLEDLSVKNKHELLDSTPFLHRELTQDMHRNVESSLLTRDKRSMDIFNGSPSYVREDKDKIILDRRKRHFENDREHFRKKQRMSNFRHRLNHHHEAPPAHMASSAHAPSLNFPGQSRLFQPAVPPYLVSGTVPSLNPPVAHTKHSAAAFLTPGLPPPPPLLNNDILHSPFNAPFYQSPISSLSNQQQLEAFLRTQSAMNRRSDFPQSAFPESTLTSSTRTSSSQFTPGTATSLQPNTVMLPYPIFLPLPVPIPIPIPLSHFLKKHQKEAEINESRSASDDLTINGDKNSSKLSVAEPDDKANSVPTKSKNCKLNYISLTKREKFVSSPDTSSYAVVNNDSQTNRLILTRNKKR